MGSTHGLVFSPDGQRLYSSSKGSVPEKNELRYWDFASRRERPERGVIKRPHRVYGLSISPDGKLLAFGTDVQTVEVWDAE